VKRIKAGDSFRANEQSEECCCYNDGLYVALYASNRKCRELSRREVCAQLTAMIGVGVVVLVAHLVKRC